MLDDSTAPAIYRVSGAMPFPKPYADLPADIIPRQVTLRDRVTIATLVPFSSPSQVPHKLSAYLCELLNREIDKGDTYPMMDPMPLSSFGPYWFANFAAVMILGDVQSVEEVTHMEECGADWTKECLGSFYIKPNYPGRSSHVCSGLFLVTDAARNRGVGRLMGEGYIEWAPKLGYTYSVFNLVYETNVASLRIWDALGFKRIGRVKGCGNLKSFPNELIDAIIFGRELGGEGDEYGSEERFDKIRYYLKTGTYPNGSDRAEKSRLRSAATHYKLIPNTTGKGEEKLMLKDKEVVSDPQEQYEIARTMHAASHGGINKTTASIAEKYHWVRIKETVSAAIRNCVECKDAAPPKPAAPANYSQRRAAAAAVAAVGGDPKPASTARGRKKVAAQADDIPSPLPALAGADPLDSPSDDPSAHPQHHGIPAPIANMAFADATDYGDMPVDPQIMQGMDWTVPHQQISSPDATQMHRFQQAHHQYNPPQHQHHHSQAQHQDHNLSHPRGMGLVDDSHLAGHSHHNSANMGNAHVLPMTHGVSNNQIDNSLNHRLTQNQNHNLHPSHQQHQQRQQQYHIPPNPSSSANDNHQHNNHHHPYADNDVVVDMDEAVDDDDDDDPDQVAERLREHLEAQMMSEAAATNRGIGGPGAGGGTGGGQAGAGAGAG